MQIGHTECSFLTWEYARKSLLEWRLQVEATMGEREYFGGDTYIDKHQNSCQVKQKMEVGKMVPQVTDPN